MYRYQRERGVSTINRRDAFSHSEQCDQFFSVASPIIGGVSHTKCRCWCHSAQNLFSSSEPEYDLTPPPEYLSSADRAFALDEPAHVRVGFSEFNIAAEPSDLGDSEASDTETGVLLEWDAGISEGLAKVRSSIPQNKAGFANWSVAELKTGKCGLCGDKLADCECVE